MSNINLEELYHRMLNDITKDELTELYYNNNRKFMIAWGEEHYNISWYYLKQIILDYYKIPIKPVELSKAQMVKNMRATKLERYKNGNYDYDKFSNTMNERYGGIGNASEIIFTKQKQSMLENYGVEFPLQSKDLGKNAWTEKAFEKGRQTLYEKTGYYNNWDNPNIGGIGRELSHTKEAINKAQMSRENTISNYPGGKEAFYKEVASKAKDTIDNYPEGRDKFYSNRQSKSNKCRKYIYNELSFDSSWELAFYIYNIDNNNDIVKCDSQHFTYYYNDKVYYYFPDFILNGEYIDIKGDHFVNSEGVLVSVYKNTNLDKLKCKYKCIIDNNVKLLFYNDIKPILNYCINRFNDNKWYKKFLRN